MQNIVKTDVSELTGTSNQFVGHGVSFQDLLNETTNMAVGNMSPPFNSAPNLHDYVFRANSNEQAHGGKLEPPHVHVATPHGEAKVWLNKDGEVKLAKSGGVPEPIINEILRHVKKYRDSFLGDWNKAVKQKKIQ